MRSSTVLEGGSAEPMRANMVCVDRFFGPHVATARQHVVRFKCQQPSMAEGASNAKQSTWRRKTAVYQGGAPRSNHLQIIAKGRSDVPGTTTIIMIQQNVAKEAVMRGDKRVIGRELTWSSGMAKRSDVLPPNIAM